MALVLAHSRLSGAQRTVLLSIANHLGEQGAWPSVKTIAREANCSERTVQRAIAAAVEAGELEVVDQDGGDRYTPGNRRPNRYHLLISCPPECDHSPNHRMRQPARGDIGVAPESARGDTGVAAGVTQVSPKPSLEPDLLPSVSQSTTGRASDGPTDGPDDGTDEPSWPDSEDPEAETETDQPGSVTDPRLTDPAFVRFLAAVAPSIRRPERFNWPPGELDALEARWRTPDPFGPRWRDGPTPQPPRLDVASLRPANAVPPPPNLRDHLRRSTA